MNLILSTTILFLALLSDGLTDQRMNIIKEIDSIYRVSTSKSDLYKLEVLLHKSIEIFPESSEIFWRLGRTYFKLGEKSNSESEKIRYFSLCLEQTKKALKTPSNLAHGYFFNGLCIGSLGQVQGIWSSLRKIKPFKKDMEMAISIDPTINQGGPHRALANLYLELPYILGGDLNRSILHFREAVQFGPRFGDNYIGLAGAYIQNENFLLAKETLQTLLSIKSGSQHQESMLKWHTEARKLLTTIPE
jgi:tetratricopeptide (TPR) repeat protein